MPILPPLRTPMIVAAVVVAGAYHANERTPHKRKQNDKNL